MDNWRAQLRKVVGSWELSPEDQTGILDELEQHLEDELAEFTPRIGEQAALDRLLVQINDPALREASIPARHKTGPAVRHSRAIDRGWSAMLRDARYGWRSFRASPGTSVMGAIALALGIGLTTVMFTIIYGLLLRGLPYEQSDRIAMIMQAKPSQGEEELALSMHDFYAYRDAQRSFQTFGGWAPTTVNLADDIEPDRVDAARLTTGALKVPNVAPALGRVFTEEDESPGSNLVVILSHEIWRDRYASQKGIVGRSVRINGIAATVVGVMPEGFRYPRDTRLWIPLRLNPSVTPWGTGLHFNGVGRLRDGVSMQQANADLSAIARGIEVQHAETNKGIRTVIQPFIRAIVPTRVYALLYAMFGAVALVLLIACTNVANLLLARTVHRSKEIAVRVALGASRGAIARQFLAEATVLCLIASAFAAAIAWGGLRAFENALVGQAPFWADFQLHPQIFAFIAGTALCASVISGFLPAVAASRAAVSDVLKDHAHSATPLRSGKLSRGLVVFELALSSTLLVVAALITKSVVNLRTLEPGFRTVGVMTARITLSARDAERQNRFFTQLDEAVQRLPGVVSASLSTNVPGPGWGGTQAAVEGVAYEKPGNVPSVRQLAVTPAFFNTFELRPLSGRVINSGDRADQLAVAVVNQRFVDRFLRDKNPLGVRLNLSPGDTVPRWVTIVGVIPNLYASDQGSVNRNQPWPAEVLTSFHQQAGVSASISLRTHGDPMALAPSLRKLVSSMDRDLPVYDLATMDDVVAKSRWDVHVFGSLFVVFGAVALVLASIGLYAVIAFTASRREREMGIRMALGATPMDVVRLVLKGGAILMVVGITVGVLTGVSAARLATAMLFEIQPTDFSVLSFVVGTLLLTGLAACLLPALRATRADPVRSLRTE